MNVYYGWQSYRLLFERLQYKESMLQVLITVDKANG